MPKLRPGDQFIDFSDYGRPPARWIANVLKNTKATSIHLTLAFGFSGLLGVYFILEHEYYLAGALLILKSILDAADGELSRVKNQPSYTGRYLDSIFDIILNFFILLSIGHVSQQSYWWVVAAFIAIQLQGTLYNYYYVILRNCTKGGDKTSQIMENKAPKAFPGEKQSMVNVMFQIFRILYIGFDETVELVDPNASKAKPFPNWFMSLVSLYGLGFQLLIMAVFLAFHKAELILPFILWYSLLFPVIIFVRRVFL
jgi:phosphatidylglycerophosphate synthase